MNAANLAQLNCGKISQNCQSVLFHFGLVKIEYIKIIYSNNTIEFASTDKTTHAVFDAHCLTQYEAYMKLASGTHLNQNDVIYLHKTNRQIEVLLLSAKDKC